MKKNLTQLTLAIHSTDSTFGFAYRVNKNNLLDNFFIKKFEKDLCNKLIVDFSYFINKENLKKISKISVSIGPANFNASRQTVVLARTLSQQMNCSLESFSSFKLMAKRIALKNNIKANGKSFWIFKKLKRRGYIAGAYKISSSTREKEDIAIKEIIVPRIFEDLVDKECSYQAEYNDLEDLRELLNLSNKITKNTTFNSWKNVKPLYPISAIN